MYNPLNGLWFLTRFLLIISFGRFLLCCKRSRYSYLTEEKIKAQRSMMTSSGSHSFLVTLELHFKLVSCFKTLLLFFSSAQLLSRYRPRAPVIAVTRCAQAARQVNLCRGVFPLLYGEPPEAIWADDVDRRVQFGIQSGEPPRPPSLPSFGICIRSPSTWLRIPLKKALHLSFDPRFSL